MQTKNIRRHSAALFFAAMSSATVNVVALSLWSGRLSALIFGAGVLGSMYIALCAATRIRAMARPVQWTERSWPVSAEVVAIGEAVELRRAA
jgi:hypothetical protein